MEKEHLKTLQPILCTKRRAEGFAVWVLHTEYNHSNNNQRQGRAQLLSTWMQIPTVMT